MKKIMAVVLLLVHAVAFADSQASSGATEQSVDNGTDPTKFSTMAAAEWERIALPGGMSSETLNFTYWQPVGAQKHANLRIRLPVARITGIGRNDYGVGDFSLKYNHLLKITPEYGVVAAVEMDFDTASRDELGAGQNVLRGVLIYAKFLENGAIFAPSIQQSNSLWGRNDRAKVNNTVLDFYYVPKFKDPKWFMTIDPALVLDWEADKKYGSLAVTVGRSIGPAFGGNSQIYIKPSVLFGGDRPGKWGIQVGYKVIGF